jgi:uncharacterized membrane protein
MPDRFQAGVTFVHQRLAVGNSECGDIVSLMQSRILISARWLLSYAAVRIFLPTRMASAKRNGGAPDFSQDRAR